MSYKGHSRTCYAGHTKRSLSEVGLNQYEVRRWDGWHRHMTPCRSTGQALAMLARVCLAAIRHQAMETGETGAVTAPMKSLFP